MSYFVILSEAKNLSSISTHKKRNKERFFASLGMTSALSSFPQPVEAVLLAVEKAGSAGV